MDDVKYLPPVTVKDVFPRLKALELQDSATELSRLFSGSLDAFLHVNYLQLDILGADNSIQVWGCLSALTTSCPSLTELEVIRNEDSTVNDGILLASQALPTTVHDLQALSRFAKLESFTITQIAPIRISITELVELVSKCTRLKTLRLNSEPLVFSQPSLSLGVLADLSEFCPRLESLSMYACANVGASTETIVPFGNLSCLNLGASPIENEDALCSYLAKLLPITCRIETDEVAFISPEDDEAEAVEQALGERRKAWTGVKARLPALVKTRIDEEERVSLRAQNRKLLAKVKELEAMRLRSHTSDADV